MPYPGPGIRDYLKMLWLCVRLFFWRKRQERRSRRDCAFLDSLTSRICVLTGGPCPVDPVTGYQHCLRRANALDRIIQGVLPDPLTGRRPLDQIQDQGDRQDQGPDQDTD